MKRIIFLILMLALAAQVRSQYATQEALEDTASAHRALIGLNLSRINTNRFNISENRSYINLNIHNISANTTNIASLTSIVSGFSSSLVNIVHTADSLAHSPDNYATFSALADTASAHRDRIEDNELGILGLTSGQWDILNTYLPAKLNKADSTGHVKDRYATRSALLDSLEGYATKSALMDTASDHWAEISANKEDILANYTEKLAKMDSTGHAKDRYATRSALLDSLSKIGERNNRFVDSESSKPDVVIENTNADNKSARITFSKNSTSPADGDTLGVILGKSYSASTGYLYNGIAFSASLNSPVHKSGDIRFWNLLDGYRRDFLRLSGYAEDVTNGSAWVNPNGANIDFRVDTEDSTKAFFVDADGNRISTNVDSISFNSSAFIKSIGRTEYGDSLFIVVTPKHAEKDTAWLPLQ